MSDETIKDEAARLAVWQALREDAAEAKWLAKRERIETEEAHLRALRIRDIESAIAERAAAATRYATDVESALAHRAFAERDATDRMALHAREVAALEAITEWLKAIALQALGVER